MTLQTILWTPDSEDSLQETYDFLLKKWGQEIADNFTKTVEFRISQIASHPNIAPSVNSKNYRKILIHKNISLFYQNEDKLTRLLLFWDNRQDPKELAKKLSSL